MLSFLVQFFCLHPSYDFVKVGHPRPAARQPDPYAPNHCCPATFPNQMGPAIFIAVAELESATHVIADAFETGQWWFRNLPTKQRQSHAPH
jgi:hypothetical protein